MSSWRAWYFCCVFSPKGLIKLEGQSIFCTFVEIYMYSNWMELLVTIIAMAIMAGCDPLLMIDVFVWYLYLGRDYAFVLELSLLLCESIFNAKVTIITGFYPRSYIRYCTLGYIVLAITSVWIYHD